MNTTDFYGNHQPGHEILGIDSEDRVYTALVRDHDEISDWYGAVRLRPDGYQDVDWYTDASTTDSGLVIEHGAISGVLWCEWLYVGGTIDGVAAVGRLQVQAWCDA